MCKYLFSATSLASLILIAGLSASAAPAGVPSNLPGAIGGYDKDPITGRPDNSQQQPSLLDPTESVPIKNETEKPELSPALSQKISIKTIQLEGFTKLTAAQTNKITAPWEGKELTFQEIQDNIVTPLNKLYEKEGYITTVVFVPPQKIEDGVVRIQATEGTVSEVVFEAGKYFKERAVVPRIQTKTGDIFRVNDLVKSLRRINENPDLVVDATLKAGEAPGETKIVLKPRKEVFPLHFTPFYDNLGRFPIGRQRLGATVTDNNTLGFGDTAYVSPYFTTHSMGILGGYEVPLGSHGTKVGFSMAHTEFDVDQAGVDFHGRSNIYQPYIMKELYRSERSIWNAELAFANKSSTFYADNVMLNQDRLRLITPALSYRHYDKTGQFYTRHELGIGLDVFGATIGSDALSSRPGAGSQFIRYTGNATRVQKLFKGTYGVFRGVGQYSPNPLVSLEQFQVGGASSVRGYQEGRLIGDSGFAVSAEWHVPLWFLPERWNVRGYKLKDNIEFVSFADFGAAFDNQAFSGVNAQSGKVNPNAYALGVGAGIRARLNRYLNARVDFGFPLLRQNPDADMMRVHFGLESRVF